LDAHEDATAYYIARVAQANAQAKSVAHAVTGTGVIANADSGYRNRAQCLDAIAPTGKK